MAPPGIPNTASHPTDSSERTRDWAPVIGIASDTGRSGRPGGGAGFGWPASGAGRGLAVVIVSSCLVRLLGSSGSRIAAAHTRKNPRHRLRRSEGCASTKDCSGADAPANYVVDKEKHACDVNRQHHQGQLSRHLFPDRGTT